MGKIYLQSYMDNHIYVMENGMIKWEFKGKKLRWIILWCRLFNWAKKSKDEKLAKLFEESLLSGDFICCEYLMRKVREMKISIPYYYSCYDCPYLTTMSKRIRANSI